MKRIAILTNEFLPYPGGVGRYCAELAEAAAQLGHRVTVFAPDYGDSNRWDDNGGYDVIRFKGGVFKLTPWRLLALIRSVRDLLSTNGYDIVHAADWPMIIALRYVRRAGEQRLATIHGSDVITLHAGRRARVSGSRHAMKMFDRYVPNSHFSGRLLRRTFSDIDPDKIGISHLGVATSWFSPPNSDAIERFAQRLPNERRRFLILTVARIEQRKGHIATLTAMGSLPASIRAAITYVCVGRAVDQSLLNQMITVAQELGVDFVFLGHIPDDELKAAYAVADLFVLGAQDSQLDVEGFGLVLLEAAAQGLPTLSTPVHAIPEVIKSGITGWTAESAEPLGIGAAIEAALRDPQVLSRIRNACKEHASQFTWKSCAERTYGEG